MGWHWEHLWLKGKRTGGRTEDTDRRRTNTSLCPSTADGEGQICSMLPGKAVDETQCCRKEQREASSNPSMLVWVTKLTGFRDETHVDILFLHTSL